LALNWENKYTGTKTNKLENCFKMLELLKQNGKMKTKNIVKELGLKSERSINYYKNTLIYMGYNIVSHGGYYGGYEYISEEKLNEDELQIIGKYLGGENSSLIEKIKNINERIR
jgi:predicted DNA-binding transcriptional regulator YafY